MQMRLNSYFNSSMVRLKVGLKDKNGKEVYEFQFLYGAIKRAFQCHGFFLHPRFQFLYGAIKSYFTLCEGYAYRIISIPLWCD